MFVTLLNFFSTASSGDGARRCGWGFLFRGFLGGWADGCVGVREKEGVTERGCDFRRIDLGSGLVTGWDLVFVESSTILSENDTDFVGVSGGISKHCVHVEKETRFVLNDVDEDFCCVFRRFQMKDQ